MSNNPTISPGELFIASHLGFCNGVRRALERVQQQINSQKPGQTLYIYNEIVHNSFIVEQLKKQGVQFIHSLDEITHPAPVVWSAHGVPPSLDRLARTRELIIIDATCPLVQRIHDLATEHCRQNDLVIFIGHQRHPETVGVLGCGPVHCVSTPDECLQLPAPDAGQKVVVLTQTTWCADDIAEILAVLQSRYSSLQVLSNICYATAERQQAVQELIQQHHIEHLLVIGSPNSSNSNRLCEVARHHGISAVLVDDPTEIKLMDFSRRPRLGISAGASAPEILLEQALEILQTQHNYHINRG